MRFVRNRCPIRAAALVLALISPCAMAGEFLEGPVAATVERVIDGDTLAIRAKIWLGQEIVVLVRLRGIDAPELRGACPDEIAKAKNAAAALASYVGVGPVTLRRIEGDKYFGRVLADVATVKTPSVAEALIAATVARRHRGGKRDLWCEEFN
jgi:micrococcal nuclease